jgi:hypothetical protein
VRCAGNLRALAARCPLVVHRVISLRVEFGRYRRMVEPNIRPPRKFMGSRPRGPTRTIDPTASGAGADFFRVWQPNCDPGRLCLGSAFWGEYMPNETLREEVMEKRRLAENARRLADLMHQPDVKQYLTRQADALERLALELEGILRASDDYSGASISSPTLMAIH